MHIAIETSPLISGHKLRGIGSYTRDLVEALQKYGNKHSYYLFTRGQKLPNNIDLIHYPYFDPFFLTLPLIKNRPIVVTVHDLIPVVFEDHFPRGVKGEIRWQVQKSSLRGVSAVLTDSFASKNDIARVTGLDQKKIHVVYLSPRESLKLVTDKKVLKDVKKKYSLPEKFILYVGDLNWNKNITGLIYAFERVHRTVPGVSLVLAGKQFLNEELAEAKEVNQLITKLALTDSVRRPGYIDETDLASLYSLASVYVQPSFAEGFGFPVLEAMACGCPVVSSNTSSLKEIAGPAFLVNPADTQSLVSGILEVLQENPSKRDEIIRRGFRWVKKFSWEKTAHETIHVYETVLA